jgi:predicted dehydrogenase
MSSGARPLRLALLGTGAWARVLARAGQGSSQLEWAGCWSRSAERVGAFAVEMGLTPIADLTSVWHDESIEGVVIALPNDVHRNYATLAACHGKHVFIEKPIADSLRDGLSIAALEPAFGVRISVGHCARLLAGNRAIQRAIDAGDLGRVTMIETRFANSRGLRLTPADWRWHQRSAPGGPLSQIAIHQLDVLHALGGDIESVSAQSARLSPAGAEVEDQWLVGVRFASGALGHVASSWTSAGEYSVRASGTTASLHYTIDQTRWADAGRLHEAATLLRTDVGTAATQRLDVEPGNMFRDELEAFAAAIRDGSEPALSADNGCRALAAVDAALLSAARGGTAVTLLEVLDAARRRDGSAVLAA